MKWRQAYADLRNLVADHDEIRLTPHVTLIPGQIRPRFYQLFDATRTAFLREHLPDYAEEMSQLKGFYFEVEESVKSMMGLEEIVVSAEVSRFLHETEERLSEPLFDRLFELLRDQTDVETFEKQSSIVLKNLYAELFHQAYRHWVVLSLIKLLGGRRLFSVKGPLIEMTARGPKIAVRPKPIPKPQETKRLSFLSESIPAFIVPNFIVDSGEAGQLVAFATEIRDLHSQSHAMWRAADADPGRGWFSHEALEPLWKRYDTLDLKQDVLFYVGDQWSELALVADSERFARPDGIMICVSRSGGTEYLHEKGRLYRDHLKPRSGVFMVLLNPAEEAPVGLFEEIYWLPAGFEQTKLFPIVRLLRQGKGS